MRFSVLIQKIVVISFLALALASQALQQDEGQCQLLGNYVRLLVPCHFNILISGRRVTVIQLIIQMDCRATNSTPV